MQGKLQLELRDSRHRLLARRAGTNSVMRTGGQLVAQLFSGQGAAINRMGVGTSDADDPTFALTSLTNDTNGDDGPLTGATEAAIAPGDFTIVPDDTARLFRVKIRATLQPADAVGTAREAGLVARTDGADAVLYNRVTFTPVTKGADHELTLFWEVSFPYGDLQNLF
jgi:hypothetical protein